jgi:hypothetical protein
MCVLGAKIRLLREVLEHLPNLMGARVEAVTPAQPAELRARRAGAASSARLSIGLLYSKVFGGGALQTENLATMYPVSAHHRMLDLNACAQDAAIGGLRH